MENPKIHSHPDVFAYDILQAKHPEHGWQDFSTIRTADEARQAVALVVSCLFDGRPMVFRIVQGGTGAVRYIHQDDPQGLDAGGQPCSRCQNCGLRWFDTALNEIQNIWQRVAPGETMPSGECPDCGALCQPCK